MYNYMINSAKCRENFWIKLWAFRVKNRFLLATESEEASRQSFCLVSDPIPALLLCSAPQGADA